MKYRACFELIFFFISSESKPPAQVLREVFCLDRVARHDEERGHFKAFELGTQAVGVVEAVHIDGLLRAGDDVHGDVIVAAVLEHHQPAM